MGGLFLLNFLKFFLQLFLHVSLLTTNVYFLLFLLFILLYLLVLQDVFVLVDLFETLYCCYLFLALSSVDFLGWFFCGACWSLLFLLLFNVLWLFVFFWILLLLWFLLVFLLCFLTHWLSFVYDVEVWTDEVVDSQLINVLLSRRNFRSLLFRPLKHYNILLVFQCVFRL